MGIQENKQLVMEGYRLFQNGDIRNLLDRYHDDAEWLSPESEFVPFAGCFHGKAEIGQFFNKLDDAVQATSFVPRQFIAEGDLVVVTGDATWLAKKTGRSYDSPWVHVFTLRDGKVARFHSYYDTAAAEHALHTDQPGGTVSAAQMHH
jgi:ketosteroid isomerase-like protein